jgi:FKBP-type peptidyl-prolyl cis-trans isomerase FkpA
MEQAVSMVQSAVRDAMKEQSDFNRKQEEEFLRDNGRKEGIVSTSSGLQYEVISQGSGEEKPGASDRVRVNYKGSLMDGTVFDSSYDREESAEFPLNAVIPGWAEGIQLMTVGAHYRLYIPSGLAYGDRGAGGVIPPNSTLIFDVELLEILPGEPEEEAGEAADGDPIQ